jgi:hypothetical protein
MTSRSKGNHAAFLLTVGILAWLVPGAGHLAIKQNKHAIIIFLTIALTFCMGLYIGSVAIINPIDAKPWFAAQVMNSPAVAVLWRLCRITDYGVYGRPSEIGQIYTSIAGLLNLLCIVNAVYWAHLRRDLNTAP